MVEAAFCNAVGAEFSGLLDLGKLGLPQRLEERGGLFEVGERGGGHFFRISTTYRWRKAGATSGLLARGPGHIKAGTTSDGPVISVPDRAGDFKRPRTERG